MTLEEFVESWERESGISAEVRKEMGLVPAPCECGDADCPGWQMTRDGR